MSIITMISITSGVTSESDAKDVTNNVTIERLIADINFRILSSVEKINHNTIRFWDEINNGLNKVAVNKNWDVRFTNLFELREISMDSRISLDKLKEDTLKGKKRTENLV